MSDSALETVEADRPPDSDPRAGKVTVGHPSSDGSLAVGQRWRGLTIVAPYPLGGAQAFVAEDAVSFGKVVVRAFPLSAATEWRRGAWERLCSMTDLPLVRSLSADEDEGWRYEISALPPVTTMQERLARRRPELPEIEAMVDQLAGTLGALHAQGVVHLNLRPTAIFIDESGPEPSFLLGGLQEATLYTQPDLKPSQVDPFYAPPEAVEATQQGSGTRFCAWDWWSMGRVVQEFVLGRHVLGVVLNRDVSRITPELQARAEQLLLEREPAGVRAGALEYMPVQPGSTPLLRGLLTGSGEARWGFDAVQRWLKHEPVQDQYELPRHARFWVYKGRGYTLPEAANHFTLAEHWEEGEDVLFQNDRAGTLAAFLADSPAHRPDHERLQAVCDLSETAGWGDVPVVARRTVTAALAWLSLANGSGVRTPLRIHGRTGDALGLAEILRGFSAAEAVALVTALLTPAVVAFIEPFDAGAARALIAMASKGGEALQHGARHGWLDLHDQEACARIYGLSLKAGGLLRDPVARLRTAYGTCVNKGLAALLDAKTPEPRDLVILAFTAEAPDRYGYITHEAWQRQRCAALKAEADRIVTAQFWIEAHRLLRLTWIWGKPTPFFASVVLVVTIVSVLASREAGPAGIVSALLLISRAYFSSRMRTMVRQFAPAAGGWVWSDGLGRARKEMEQTVEQVKLPASALGGELTRVRSAMADLFKSPGEAPVIAPPRFWDLWTALGISVAVAFAVIVSQLVERVPDLAISPRAAGVPPVVAPEAVKESHATDAPGTIDATKTVVEPAALLATGEYEVVNEGFGRQLRGPLPRWTFFVTNEVTALDVVGREQASPEQSAFALVSGTLLVQPYLRASVTGYLAIKVPTERGSGVMVFNARDRKLLDHQVLLVREPLRQGSWYRMGSRRIGYLGMPAGLSAEISLAPP